MSLIVLDTMLHFSLHVCIIHTMYKEVQAHWFHVQGYCDCQLYLKVRGGIDAEHTKELMDGIHAHADLDKELNVNDVHVSQLEDRVYQAQAKNQPFTVREAAVSGARIYGRIDCLEYHLNKVVISDNKPKPSTGEPFPGDKRQLFAYCMAFSAQFPNTTSPIIAVFRDHDDKEYWSHEFVESDKADVINTVDRILDILNEVRQPFPAKEFKCRTCHYLSMCRWSPLKAFRR